MAEKTQSIPLSDQVSWDSFLDAYIKEKEYTEKFKVLAWQAIADVAQSRRKGWLDKHEKLTNEWKEETNG